MFVGVLSLHTYEKFKHACMHTYTQSPEKSMHSSYGVALVSRIDKSIGLFCKRAL